jgi:lipooligosaccharide transport system ATP-binding protein
MNIVSAKGLTKDYGSLRAIDNINFDILKGECFGFLGPNGAGKTTAMSIIYCFMPPTSGETTAMSIIYCFMPPTSGDVMVFNMDVMKDPGRIKSKIGVMPQDNNLDPDFTVLENILVYARYFDIPKKESSRLAWELFDFVELGEKAGVNIKDLYEAKTPPCKGINKQTRIVNP